MNEVKAEPAALRMTVEIVRAKTGKVETYELTGTPVVEQPEEKEADNGRDASDSLS